MAEKIPNKDQTVHLIKLLNRPEKIALLKLLMKFTLADGQVTSDEKRDIQAFLRLTNLKITEEYWGRIQEEEISEIVSSFSNRSSLKRGRQLVESFVHAHGIHPEIELPVVEEMEAAFEARKSQLKRGPSHWIKELRNGISFLWGKDEIHPTTKKILATFFTILACFAGSFWTESWFGVFFKKTEWAIPPFSAVLAGLLIYGALAVRNYLPRPNRFRNFPLFFADVYLLSIISMHIIGRGNIEKTISIAIFFGIIALLWLGMKEIMGYFLIGLFLLTLWKMTSIDSRLGAWGFPFIAFTYLGITFQSENFFDELDLFKNAFFKPRATERALTYESNSAKIPLERA
jgi:hypothetical protein